jgi:hypothetical protein
MEERGIERLREISSVFVFTLANVGEAAGKIEGKSEPENRIAPT